MYNLYSVFVINQGFENDTHLLTRNEKNVNPSTLYLYI